MFEKTLDTTLKFSIVGSSSENIDIIKKAFSELPIRIVLHNIYRSSKGFIAANSLSEIVDFIAIDKCLFTELEEEQLVAVPLLVFANELEIINSAHHIIFDIISIPVINQSLLNTVSKLDGIKRHFEKNTSGINLTTIK